MAFLKQARYGLWLALALALWAPLGRAQSSENRLKEFKAAYLCRFVGYVDWPAGSFANADSPLVIGVLGADPFGKLLDDLAQGTNSAGHPLKVQRFDSVTAATNCQVLFIASDETSRLAGILRQLDGKAILTVSDIPTFTARGGVIQFVIENNKLRFHINLGAAKSAKLTISSRLLQLTSVVIEGTQAP